MKLLEQEKLGSGVALNLLLLYRIMLDIHGILHISQLMLTSS